MDAITYLKVLNVNKLERVDEPSVCSAVARERLNTLQVSQILITPALAKKSKRFVNSKTIAAGLQTWH